MSWSDFIETHEWKTLFGASPLSEQIASIDRQLVDPSTTWDRTLELRGMRLGILSAQYHAEELAMREQQPVAQDEEGDLEQRDYERIQKIMGMRPLWTPRRKPKPPAERQIARFRRGA